MPIVSMVVHVIKVYAIAIMAMEDPIVVKIVSYVVWMAERVQIVFVTAPLDTLDQIVKTRVRMNSICISFNACH